MRTVALIAAGVALGIVVSALGMWGMMHYSVRHRATLTDSFTPNVDEQFAKARARLDNARDEYDRWVALDDVAFWSVDVGALDQATDHANALLAKAEKHKADWNYGNAIHKGNLTLGRVALRKGDTAAAKRYLVAAGKTRGSPQLKSFGPNMLLAKELLEAGETETVLEYFHVCGEFWKNDFGALATWRDLVFKGQSSELRGELALLMRHAL